MQPTSVGISTRTVLVHLVRILYVTEGQRTVGGGPLSFKDLCPKIGYNMYYMAHMSHQISMRRVVEGQCPLVSFR